MKNLLTPLTTETASDKAKPILAQIKKSYGFVPNLMATFANSPAVLEGYVGLDKSWEGSSLSSVERQLILLAVSVQNECGYCTAAHSTVLKGGLRVSAETVKAVRQGNPLQDPKHDALVRLTREIVAERGHVSEATMKRFLDAGYNGTQVMEVLIGVALKTISNYLDHMNPVPLDAAFQPEK